MCGCPMVVIIFICLNRQYGKGNSRSSSASLQLSNVINARHKVQIIWSLKAIEPTKCRSHSRWFLVYCAHFCFRGFVCLLPSICRRDQSPEMSLRHFRFCVNNPACVCVRDFALRSMAHKIICMRSQFHQILCCRLLCTSHIIRRAYISYSPHAVSRYSLDRRNMYHECGMFGLLARCVRVFISIQIHRTCE